MDEINKYQEKFNKYILSDNWDIIADRLNDSLMSIITITMNAKSEKDVSYLVLQNLEYALNKVKEIDRSLKKSRRR